jgi:hypothetical protein
MGPGFPHGSVRGLKAHGTPALALFHPEVGRPAGMELARKKVGSPMPLSAGIVPLTQLRVRLGSASPTLRNSLSHWGRGPPTNEQVKSAGR